jgi:hypothetical protein
MNAGQMVVGTVATLFIVGTSSLLIDSFLHHTKNRPKKKIIENYSEEDDEIVDVVENSDTFFT